MEFAAAKTAILKILQKLGKAKNSVMLDAIGNDKALFELVREDLIFNDLAEDKKGVGLIYIADQATEPAKAHAIEPETFDPANKIEIDETQVFISYGHADAFEFASRLRTDLVRHGYKAWMDNKTMAGGTNWVIQIEDGIACSFALIAVLTPHSTREGGWCHKEVLLAHNDGKHIIPVQPVAQNIRSLLLVDLHQVDFSGSYDAGLQDLLRTLESYQKKSATAATQRAILSNAPPAAKNDIADVSGIKPFNFAREISAYLDVFVGRRWLNQKIDDWLTHQESRVFVLIGEAGIGKSAIACWLSQERDHQVVSLHLCTRRNMRTLNPYEYVAALVRQLVEMLPGYDAAIAELDLKKRRATAIEAFEELIVAPLKNITPPAETRLLIVDSLDEALLQEGGTVLDVIVAGAPQLPPWLRLFCTTRPEEPVLERIRGLNSFALEADQKENQQDVADYLTDACQQPDLNKQLGTSAAGVAQKLTQLAHGNFLYARMAIEALQRQELEPAGLNQLSGGLEDFYARAFERRFPEDEDYASRIKPLLELLTAARGPLAFTTLQRALNIDEKELRLRLQPLRIYLRRVLIESVPYVLFQHKSLRDWLTDPGRAGRFVVMEKNGHAQLSKVLQDTWNKDAYALRYLPFHLLAAEKWDEVVDLLCDLEYIQAKCAAKMTYELVQDMNAALQALPENQINIAAEQKQQQRMAQYTRDLIACAKGEITIDELEIPESVSPWPEEKIAAKIEQMKTAPTRLDRLTDFRNFLGREAANLQEYAAEFSNFAMQQAWNHAAIGPVGRKATEFITQNPEKSRTLLRRTEPTRPPWNPLPQARQTLKGHFVVITPDSTKAVSASSDKTSILWDLQTGQPIKIFKELCILSITPDGKKALSISESDDNICVLWDTDSVSPLKFLKGHTSPINSVSITPDGKMAISASYDKTCILWDLDSGTPLKYLKGHISAVNSIAITPDGKKAVSGSSDKTCILWDLDSGTPLKYLKGHMSAVNSVDITPDGKKAVSGSSDKTCILWDFDSGIPLKFLKGHTSVVNSVAITPDGKKVVSGSSDKTCILWGFDSGIPLKFLKGHTNWVYSIVITSDGRKAISTSRDNTCIIWDLETGQLFNTLNNGHTNTVNSVAITPSGKKAISASSDNTCILWDINSVTPQKFLTGHTNWVYSVVITPDGKRAISASEDSTCILWNLDSGMPLKSLKGHTNWVNSVAINPNGKKAISASSDNTCIIWDLDSDTAPQSLKGHTDYVNSVAFTPDGKKAISASADNTCIVWDINSGTPQMSLIGHTSLINAAVITPDGKNVVSASDDNTCILWNLYSGILLKSLKGHTSPVTFIAISPDGKKIVTASDDKNCLLWDIDSGIPIKSLTGHKSFINSLAITPDGKKVVSGSSDKTCILWDIVSGAKLALFTAQSYIKALRVFHTGIFGGESSGAVFGLRANINYAPSIVTARRIWDFERHSYQPFSTDCPLCGHRFAPEKKHLNTITAILRDNHIGPDDSPCLKLPHEAWEEPGLLATCPKCGGALRFNPFLVGGDE